MEEKNNILVDRQNLSFLEYDKDDLKQHLFLKDMLNDREIAKYISDIVGDIINSTYGDNSKTNGYLVRDEEIDEYVGLCVIKPACYDVTAAPIERAVHSKYRSSNKKYGTQILNNITSLVFRDENCSKAVLEIRGHNLPAIKSAMNAGFTVDYELLETFYYEGYNYMAYSKFNPNYHHTVSTSNIKTR